MNFYQRKTNLVRYENCLFADSHSTFNRCKISVYKLQYVNEVDDVRRTGWNKDLNKMTNWV